MSENIQKLIDERIKILDDWRGEAVKKLVEIVRSFQPSLEEEWKWDTLVWSKDGLICAVGAFKDKVSLNFFKGALLNDSKKIFNDGLEAKSSRRISYFEKDRINEDDLKDILKQTLELNSKN
jgi:hypothetical protein